MKRFWCLLLALLLLIPTQAVCAADDDGKVYISTSQELFALSARVAGGDSMAGIDVLLTADIVLDAPFTPIGVSFDAPFSGSFHGGGHKISGLVVSGDDYVGLFGFVYGGSIDGIRLENAVATGKNYVALLVGRMYAYEAQTAISNCAVSGTVNAECYVGGIVGYLGAAAFGEYASACVSGCTVDGTVKGDIHVGGIAGKAESRSTSSRAEAVIESCASKCRVGAVGRYASLSGGICGALQAESSGGSAVSKAESCVSYSTVSAEITAAGGISGAVGAEGFGALASVKGCIAFGAVDSAALSGGISGKCEIREDATAEINDCIAACNISGGSINAISAGEGVVNCQSTENGGVSYPNGIIPPVFERGDANGDGACDNVDAALVLKYDVGIMILGAAALSACDMNANGTCDNVDAAFILRFDAGL